MIKILLLIALNAAAATLAILEQPIYNAEEETEIEWKIPQIPQRKLSNVKLPLWGGDYEKNFTTSSKRTTGSSRKSRNKRNDKLNLTGIIKQGKNNYILLTDKNQSNKYDIGSLLPDGSKLLKIKDDFIEVMKDDKVKLIYLYPQKK